MGKGPSKLRAQAIMTPANIIEIELSEHELIEKADALAEWGGCSSRQEAFARLDAGDFEGTILACELSGVRFLLDEYRVTE